MNTNCAFGILSLGIGFVLISNHNELPNELQHPDFIASRKKISQNSVQDRILVPGLDEMDERSPSKDFSEKWTEFHL